MNRTKQPKPPSSGTPKEECNSNFRPSAGGVPEAAKGPVYTCSLSGGVLLFQRGLLSIHERERKIKGGVWKFERSHSTGMVFSALATAPNFSAGEKHNGKGHAVRKKEFKLLKKVAAPKNKKKEPQVKTWPMQTRLKRIKSRLTVQISSVSATKKE